MSVINQYRFYLPKPFCVITLISLIMSVIKLMIYDILTPSLFFLPKSTNCPSLCMTTNLNQRFFLLPPMANNKVKKVSFIPSSIKAWHFTSKRSKGSQVFIQLNQETKQVLVNAMPAKEMHRAESEQAIEIRFQHGADTFDIIGRFLRKKNRLSYDLLANGHHANIKLL